MTPAAPAVSAVIPVHNGARWIAQVLAAIETQRYGGPVEIIAVDDGSTDGSRALLERARDAGRVRLVDGPRRGAAAALNAGVRAAAHDLIAQIDQDVVIRDGWLDRLTSALRDPNVAAAQGHFVAPSDAPLLARVMGLDLAERYRALEASTNHVCTGNSVYRKPALLAVGLFDEALGYGYDNDLSYRLIAAGHRLAFRRDATSEHHWRSGLGGYVRQQYGFGYGRLDLVALHQDRMTGDDVSPLAMMLHAPLMLLAAILTLTSAGLALASLQWQIPATIAAAVFATLSLERLATGIRAAVASRDAAALAFPAVHAIRDLAWSAAIAVWVTRRVLRIAPAPAHSMPHAAHEHLFPSE